MNDNRDKQWPQNYYKKADEVSLYVNNNTQSFYNTANHTLNDCSQCYYQTYDNKKNEENYPQSFYNHQSNK